jgi:hypothetical protein
MVVPGERHQRYAHGRDWLECLGWQEELRLKRAQDRLRGVFRSDRLNAWRRNRGG